jgi:hypothetical protein
MKENLLKIFIILGFWYFFIYGAFCYAIAGLRGVAIGSCFILLGVFGGLLTKFLLEKKQ